MEGSQLLIDKLNHDGFCFSVMERDYRSNVFTKFEQILVSSSIVKYNSSGQMSDNNPRFKVRIVSSRGPSGQKCPRWHVDHVQIRLVLSLIGPGSVHIPLDHEQRWVSKHGNALVNRDALNNLDEEDSKKANQVILPFGDNNMAIKAKAGDAVFMMGKAWEDISDEKGILPGGAIKALVHKSPTLHAHEARVLLTVDIL